MKTSIAQVLEPRLTAIIAEVFELQNPKEIHDGSKKNFLPRQTALHVLKRRFHCKNNHIRKTYGALGGTIDTACDHISGLLQSAGEEATKISAVESKLMAEVEAEGPLKESLTAATNGHVSPGAFGSG